MSEFVRKHHKQLPFVMAGAMAGASMRLLLTEHVNYAQRFEISVTGPVILPNCLGCFVYGLTDILTNCFLKEHNFGWCSAARALVLSGFCGSLTSFSSVIAEESSLLIMAEYWTDPMWRYRFADICMNVIIHYGVAFGMLKSGEALAVCIRDLVQQRKDVIWVCSNQSSHDEEKYRIQSQGSYYKDPREIKLSEPESLDIESETLTVTNDNDKEINLWAWLGAWGSGVLIFLFVLSFGAVKTKGIESQTEVTRDKVCYMLVATFAPIGAGLRWLSGGMLNKRKFVRNIPEFPWGTLVVNLSALVFVDLYWTRETTGRESPWLYVMDYGVSLGFAGSLSTMSSYISELSTLPHFSALIYGLMTHSSALVILFCIDLIIKRKVYA